MQKILAKIHEHQELIGAPKKHDQEYINQLTLATQMELSEVLDNLPWKPWKRPVHQKTNYKAAALEIIDALIFLLDVWRQLDMDWDLEQVLCDTIDDNINRLIDGDKYADKQHTRIGGELTK